MELGAVSVAGIADDFSITTDSMGDFFNGSGTLFNDTTHNSTGTDLLTTMFTTLVTMGPTTPKPCSPYDRPLCNPYMIAAYNFAIYGITVNYAIGIPGSLITMLLLFRMGPFNSASVWLFGMAFLDFANLTFRAFKTVLIDQTKYMLWNDAYCRTYYIFALSTEHAGYLILTALTVERFIAVWFPLKMNVWCKKRNAFIGVICVLIFCVLTDMHFVKTMRLGVVAGYCVIRKKYRPVWEYLYMDRIQGVLLKIVPVFSLLIMNLLIVIRLMRNRGIHVNISDDQAKEKQRQQRQINRMLFAATAWFLFCVIPDLVYRYTRHLWGERMDPQVYTAKWVAMNAFSSLVLYNHSGNFVMYIIAARKFRSELIKLITCGKFSLDSKAGLTRVSKSGMSKSGTKSTKFSSTN